MAITYPSHLPLPLEGKSKDQSRVIRETQPLSGPAYTEDLSTDAPCFYDLKWTLNKANSLVFLAWVEVNSIHKGVEFEMPLRNQATDYGGNATQTVKLVAGDIRSSSNDGLGNYSYAGKFRCRKEVTGVEDQYQNIVDGGEYLINGMPILDISINGLAPEA